MVYATLVMADLVMLARDVDADGSGAAQIGDQVVIEVAGRQHLRRIPGRQLWSGR